MSKINEQETARIIDAYSEKAVLDLLRKADLSQFPDVSKLGPLQNGLWALLISKDLAKTKAITAKTISAILYELKTLDFDENSILRAFARAGDKVKTVEDKGIVYYELRQPGRDYLMTMASIRTAHFFSGKNSWTDSQHNLQKIFDLLKGDLRIVDPYYGLGSLFALDKLGNTRHIRFLTSQLGRGEDKVKFDNFHKKFKTQFDKIEIKICSGPAELHDRYIIADNGLVIIGHGLKDVGSKESFLVFLFEEEVKHFLPVLKNEFDNRWAKSKVL